MNVKEISRIVFDGVEYEAYTLLNHALYNVCERCDLYEYCIKHHYDETLRRICGDFGEHILFRKVKNK